MAYDHCDKKDENGVVSFAKARYTVMGCFQTAGVDYTDVFAPVMTLQTFRTACVLANLNPDSVIEQWDVKGAYLYAKLEDEVYCDQPIGHEDTSQPNMVWRLLKSLYGLPVAGRNWNLYLKKILARNVELGRCRMTQELSC